ncbi:MAG: flagellar biosynthesis protein FlgL [Pseudomonadota bacterium]
MTVVGNSTSAFYERSLSQMTALRGSIETLQTQIATGQKIQRGSDDPAAAGRLRALLRAERLGDVEAESAAKLEQDLSIAADELGGVNDLLIRARELAVQAGSDTLGEEARAIVAEELEQLGEELFARANGTTLTGEPLFAGTAAGPAFTRDTNGVVTYAGNLENGAVPVAPGIEVERGVAGPQVFEFDLNGTPTSAFAVLSGLADALRGGSADPSAAALGAIAGIDEALDTSTRSQTVLGTRLAWVEVLQQNQVNRGISLAEQRSEVGDTDISDAITRLQQTLTALEASQATFSRVSSLTLFNAL